MFTRGTKVFPDDEQYGLISQMRRAASSIPANLAEGCGRGSDADFGRFVQNAMGPSAEVEYHLLLAKDLGYLHGDRYALLNEETIRIQRMLASLIRRLKATK